MNKHIEEIVGQCETTYIDRHNRYYFEFDKEKFAELLIQACASLMYGRDENGNCKDGDVIKQHFELSRQ